ncbi:hypothetical protein FM037_14685 [Shewanella psychropiezotolerans]|uniref:Uncharacterized protein n=1 Tax=Shewanella psychropiezotolerans TaxID=2593655 RepID=A0ABX5WYS2_9GAMM|nr:MULTISPECIES: hypothetical protein [Shewanella]MPY23994.1 hypothetical protein [Shewanella sp. YLB-07]QDO84252.1 hypothetical protein FM037_14685 [Shewanella psychropiezotolerans]
MSRITQLEDDIKQGNKNHEGYRTRMKEMRGRAVLLKTHGNESCLEAVDAAEEVIDILFSRYGR